MFYLEIQYLNLSLSCKVKQLISACKFICKNLANYQLCIRFHLNFTMRRRHGCRTHRRRELFFGFARVPLRRYGLPPHGVGHRLPRPRFAARRGTAPRYGSRACLVGIPHHASRGRSAQRLRFLRTEALRVVRPNRSGHPSGPGAAAGTSFSSEPPAAAPRIGFKNQTNVC